MKFKKKALVCVSNDLVTDNRVAKACLVLQELGYEIILVGRLRKNSPEMDVRTYNTRRFHLWFDHGALFYMHLNIRLFVFLLFRKANLIYSNDLDTLLPCYLVAKMKKKTKLIYDTHELFTEVPELISRPKIRNIWLAIEKRIFPKLSTVITVNESIAALYESKYEVPVNSIRNVPPLGQGHQEIQNRSALGIKDDAFILIIQGSGLNKDRGIEESILAMQTCLGCVLLLVGDGDVIPAAKEMVKNLKLEPRVKFISRRPYKELMKITRLADLGLLVDKNTSQNHELALPNKLFDYIHAETPILSSKLIEISKVVKKYDIGIFIEGTTPESISTAINNYKDNKTLQLKHKENCRNAALIENWEVEKEKLMNILFNANLS